MLCTYIPPILVNAIHAYLVAYNTCRRRTYDAISNSEVPRFIVREPERFVLIPTPMYFMLPIACFQL